MKTEDRSELMQRARGTYYRNQDIREKCLTRSQASVGREFNLCREAIRRIVNQKGK